VKLKEYSYMQVEICKVRKGDSILSRAGLRKLLGDIKLGISSEEGVRRITFIKRE